MVEFRLGKEFGTGKYRMRFGDGGRMAALISSFEGGISVSSGNKIRTKTSRGSTEVCLWFELST